MRFRRLVAILRHGGADLIALAFGLCPGRAGQQKRQPHGGHHHAFDHYREHLFYRERQKFALPVAATATKVSSAAEKQKEHNDNQEQFHGSLL